MDHERFMIIKWAIWDPSAHSLLWYPPGQGFPLHRDSVPPFDLTLDYVVDHVGPEVRKRSGQIA